MAELEMISYMNSAFNVANICVVIVFVITFFYLWRRWFGKVKVNCWFCNTNCFVRYRMQNSWHCPHCHQYNGFTASGDYNSSIPGMHHEHLNTPAGNLATPAKNDTTFADQPIHLCTKCTRNQLLKVKQMSQFEPIREDNFQQEAKAYEKKLDKLYSLCETCQDATNRHIRMQDTIIRGSMLSRKRLVMKQAENSADNNNNHGAMKFNNIYSSMNSVLWAVVFVSSIVYACSVAVSSLSTALNPMSFLVRFPGNFVVDVCHSVAICGFVCSIMGTVFETSLKRSNMWCTLLWLFHVFAIPWLKKLNAVQIVTSPVMTTLKQAIHGMDNSSFKQPLIHLAMLAFLYLASVLALIVSSGICLYHCKNNYKPAALKATMTGKSKKFVRSYQNQRSSLVTSSVPKDDDLYSDCSMPSEDEVSPVSKRQHLNGGAGNSMDQCLNGSLLGLNLHDAQHPGLDQARQPTSNSGFTSALHTPPPSRSSSLLSLTSHHSGQNYLPGSSIAGGTSTPHQPEFAKPYDNIPFSRYKSYTTVSGVPNHKAIGDTKSSASFPASNWNNFNKPGTPRQIIPLSSKRGSRPLISPAKLDWRGMNQRKRAFNATSTFRQSPFKTNTSNWEQKSQLDISFHDSVSQTGDNYRPELSDNEDEFTFQTPRKQTLQQNDVDMNSSSPRSVISNLSSVTMKGIEEVENSRLCKWLMFACLVLNLVLVVLLIWDVKVMREAQSWKIGSSTL